jgi:hypothetical protein
MLDITSIKFSFFSGGIKQKKPKKLVALQEVLEAIKSTKYAEQITKLRGFENKDVAKVFKQDLDYVTFSGEFTTRLTDNLKKHSGLICMDFDALEDVAKTKDILKLDAYTLAVFVSPSGNGLKVLVAIDGAKHLESFIWLEKYYKENYSLEVDPSGKDITRACFLSYDADLFVNLSSTVCPVISLEKETTPVASSPENIAATLHDLSREQRKNYDRVLYTLEQIEKNQIDITSDYQDWGVICLGLSTLGEPGRDLYHRVSQFHPQYKRKDCDVKFDHALKNNRSLRTPSKFFSIAKDYGIDTSLPKQIAPANLDQPDKPKISLPDGANPDDYERFGFWEHEGKYWTINQRGGIQEVSNFTIKILYHVQTSVEEAYRLVEIKNVYHNVAVINLNTDDFVSVTSFKKVVARRGNFIFKGTDVDLARLQDKLQRDERPTQLVDVLGWHKKANAYFFANGMYSCATSEFITTDDYGILKHDERNYFIPAMSKIFAHKDDMYVNDKKFVFLKNDSINFETWSNQFVKVYGKQGWMTITFYCASLFRDVIYTDLNRRFPILNMYGQRGSGKGTIIESILRMFGHGQNQIMLGGDSTSVGFMRKFAQFKNAIVWLDEYKNNLKSKIIESIKNIFDGIGYERGKKDNSFNTETVPINSCCILSGQEMPTIEPALFSRVIMLTFIERQLTTTDREEYQKLKAMEDAGVSFLTVELLHHRQDFVNYYKAVYQEEFSLLIKTIDNPVIMERMLSNYAAMIATCRIMVKKEKLPFTLEQFREYCIELLNRQYYILDGADDTSKFWEIVESLFNKGIIAEGKDFELREGHLLIRVQNVYGDYAKELRQRNDPNILAKSTLENYLESDKATYIKKGKKMFADGSYQSTWFFDYAKLDINLMRIEDATERTRKMKEMKVYVEDELPAKVAQDQETEPEIPQRLLPF